MSLQILNPVKTVQVGGEQIEVREIKWRDAVQFLQELSKQAANFITPQGNLQLSADNLPSVVIQSASLIDLLLTKSTGKDSAWINDLNPHDVLVLIDAAIELNASPELFARGKTVAGRLKAVFVGQTGAVSTKSTPSNAMP